MEVWIVDDIVLKIDSIELKFKNEDGKIESLDEFSSNFDQGFYLDVHSETFKDTKVVLCLQSNLGIHTFSFGFNRKDVVWGHYLVDKLVQKWKIIWEWFHQASIDSKSSFDDMESQINHDNLDWVIDFDDKNSFGKIRNESLYFDHDLRVWVDLEYSLSAIRELISKVDVYSTYIRVYSLFK